MIRRDPHNGEVIKPYIGGQELNSSPTLSHNRCVINFGERTLEQAEGWPELVEILLEKVKPERDKNNRDNYRLRWWQFGEARPGLYRTIAHLKRCLAGSQVSKHLVLAFQPTDRTFAHTLNIFAFDDYYHFAILQSRLHEYWARALGSSMKTDLRYTPSTCFETFPFPRPNEAQLQAIEAAGEALYRLRSEIMLTNNQGMTQVWNRLTDEDNTEAEIVQLRHLRDVMDRAVLGAYGWGDVDPSDKDTLLTRLRKLNQERAAEDAAKVSPPTRGKRG